MSLSHGVHFLQFIPNSEAREGRRIPVPRSSSVNFVFWMMLTSINFTPYLLSPPYFKPPSWLSEIIQMTVLHIFLLQIHSPRRRQSDLIKMQILPCHCWLSLHFASHYCGDNNFKCPTFSGCQPQCQPPRGHSSPDQGSQGPVCCCVLGAPSPLPPALTWLTPAPAAHSRRLTPFPGRAQEAAETLRTCLQHPALPLWGTYYNFNIN